MMESRKTTLLNVADHSRDLAGYRYVYPVLSRRAGGVSVGINLNVNNACNWACIYCQVPGLRRGGPEVVDVGLLLKELDGLLDEVDNGLFVLPDGVPARLVDIAFSGNGEPTAAKELGLIVERLGLLLEERGLSGRLPVRVITNGSLLHRPAVQAALKRIALLGGEVWFKLDRAGEPERALVNQTAMNNAQVLSRLEMALDCAPVWLQTCWFGLDGVAPSPQEEIDFLDLLSPYVNRLCGVHLYGIARPSLQTLAPRLTRLSAEALAAFGSRLKQQGLTVTVNP